MKKIGLLFTVLLMASACKKESVCNTPGKGTVIYENNTTYNAVVTDENGQELWTVPARSTLKIEYNAGCGFIPGGGYYCLKECETKKYTF